MKLIEPSVEMWGQVPTDYEGNLVLIEKAGRVCYKSEDKIKPGTAERFVDKLTDRKHWAMLEHSNLVIRATGPFDCWYGKYLDVYQGAKYTYAGGNLRAWMEWLEYEDVQGVYDYWTRNQLWEICPHEEIPDCLHRYTVKFITNRAVTHELVRHRPCSFCLSGDTTIRGFSEKEGGKSWTIKQLFDWSTDPKRKGRIKLIRLRSVDEEGRLVPGRIKQVVYSGKKLVYTLTTLGGKTLTASADHLIKTPAGWKKLKELLVGDRVLANSKKVAINEDWLRDQYLTKNKTRAEVASLSGCCEATVFKAFKRFGIFKPWVDRPNRRPGYGKPGMFSAKQREKIGEDKKGDKNPNWKGDNAKPNSGRCRANRQYTDIGDCWGCGKQKRTERHHVDGNPLNNDLENILPLCQKCHKSFHIGQGVRAVYSDQIVSIVSLGQEDTYDIEMETAPHNFVADGIVVHNSQESQRYVDYQGELEFIRPWWTDGYDAADFSSPFTVFIDSCELAEVQYKKLRKKGLTPQQARVVLPNSTKTEIVVTADAEEWALIKKLRTAKDADPEMQKVMNMVKWEEVD